MSQKKDAKIMHLCTFFYGLNLKSNLLYIQIKDTKSWSYTMPSASDIVENVSKLFQGALEILTVVYSELGLLTESW